MITVISKHACYRYNLNVKLTYLNTVITPINLQNLILGSQFKSNTTTFKKCTPQYCRLDGRLTQHH